MRVRKRKYTVGILIFDLDGTLVDTLQDIVDSVNHSLRRIGFKTHQDEHIRGLIGDGITNLMKWALRTEDEEAVQESLNHFRNYYKNHFMDYSRLYHGIDGVLQHFNGLIKCIISNKTQEFVDLLLAGLKILDQFDEVIGGQSGFKYKPDPESILYLLNKYDMDSKYAMIIGDSINDIIAGKNAGIKTCAVSYGFSAKVELESANPDIIIDDPRELCKIIIPYH